MSLALIQDVDVNWGGIQAREGEVFPQPEPEPELEPEPEPELASIRWLQRAS
jgi:hypothetical protein